MSPRETRRIGAGEERGRQGWLGPSEVEKGREGQKRVRPTGGPDEDLN